jgi:hypothetical protein
MSQQIIISVVGPVKLKQKFVEVIVPRGILMDSMGEDKNEKRRIYYVLSATRKRTHVARV